MKNKAKLGVLITFLSMGIFTTLYSFNGDDRLAPTDGEKCVWDLQTGCVDPPVELNCTGCE